MFKRIVSASFILLTAVTQEWCGIPTRLNNIPHSREIRKYFYDDVLQATKCAIEDKKTRLQVADYLFN
jgi:adenylate kinase